MVEHDRRRKNALRRAEQELNTVQQHLDRILEVFKVGDKTQLDYLLATAAEFRTASASDPALQDGMFAGIDQVCRAIAELERYCRCRSPNAVSSSRTFPASMGRGEPLKVQGMTSPLTGTWYVDHVSCFECYSLPSSKEIKLIRISWSKTVCSWTARFQLEHASYLSNALFHPRGDPGSGRVPDQGSQPRRSQ